MPYIYNVKIKVRMNRLSLKKSLQFGCFILLVNFLASCGGSKKIVDNSPKPIDSYAFDFVYSDNLASVLKQAERENKLVFIDVFTSWCLPCKMMDKDVFTHQETADVINKDFISYKVNAEKDNGPILSFNYDVQAYPTLLFLDSSGNVLERKSGAAYHSELLSLAQSALDQVVLGD